MEFRIWVETRLGGRILERQIVAQVKRQASAIGPEEIGLTLEEGKIVLGQVQADIIHRQVEALQAAHWHCSHCGRKQRIQDRRSRSLRTVFGVVRVSCRRYRRCTCRGGKKGIVWPLNWRQIPATTPELQYLYATWGSRVPYRRAAALLQELLPIGARRVSHATLRRHTLKVGARLNERVIEPSEYDWPESRREPVPAAKNLSIAIDGTYVRADRRMWLGEYQVVAGRVERDGKLGGHFAWVPQYRFCMTEDSMNAALEANGWTPKSQVRVLADGADGLSNLVSASAGKTTERVLDWFHISMRLRPIEQMAPKIAIAADDSDAELKHLLTEKLSRIRYQLWHGKRAAALERIEDIYSATKRLLGSGGSIDDTERVRRFRGHMIELRRLLTQQLVRTKGLRSGAAKGPEDFKCSGRVGN